MRKFLAALAIAVGLIGSQVVVNPAHASWSQCQTGQFCTWKGYTFTGDMYYYTYTPLCVEIGGTWDNKIVSLRNNTSHGVYIYNNHGCTTGGGVYLINPGVSYGDLWDIGAGWWISSIRFT